MSLDDLKLIVGFFGLFFMLIGVVILAGSTTHLISGDFASNVSEIIVGAFVALLGATLTFATFWIKVLEKVLDFLSDLWHGILETFT